MERTVGVIGLGYVGLPLALHFARHVKTVGFDINAEKVQALSKGVDVTNEGNERELESTKLEMTADPKNLKKCDFFIVGVPTPVDENNNPDFRPLMSACEVVGNVLKPGDIVVFESTVYPGVTEEICGPRLAEISGLKMYKDFALGYSPGAFFWCLLVFEVPCLPQGMRHPCLYFLKIRPSMASPASRARVPRVFRKPFF